MIALIDTHVVIWLVTGDANLGKQTQALLHRASREGAVVVSAISFWEIALLLERGRLSAVPPVHELRRDLLNTGVEELPLSGEIAILSQSLKLHGDPADRFIAASALVHEATLVTADERLLRWKQRIRRHNARR